MRLQPGARREVLGGAQALADGSVVLRAWVTAPPVGGKANARLLALMARSWRLPKGDFEVASGARDRRKSVLLRGDPQALLTRLEAWLAAANGR